MAEMIVGNGSSALTYIGSSENVRLIYTFH